jgi:protein-disulfide isomerase
MKPAITALFALAAVLSAQPAATEPEAVIQVFSDFQCPYCKQFAGPVREFETKGVEGIRTKVEFKNFPLGFHQFAQLAAQAAVAAGEQNKFWEMHDLLFANQNALKREDLLKYAESLKLDLPSFTRDLDSDRVKKIIDADKAEAAGKKVQGTPTFFVNGKEYSGSKSYEELARLVRTDVYRKTALAEISDASMSKGPAKAPVTIEFFADLESPVTPIASRVLDELMAKYPAKIRLQFRNFPLSFHPQATLTHTAAMTAARDGHFWEMAEYVLDHQDSVREQDLIAYAGRLGMNEVQFAETVQKRKYTPRVDADIEDGFRRGVRGSPVIFIGGHQIDGVPSMQMLTKYVDAELSGAVQTAKK